MTGRNVSSTRSKDESRKDDVFYMESVVFKAENTLFKVPGYALPSGENGVFASMFALPQGPNTEGSEDKNPIVLPPEISAQDFKSLLKACVPMPRSQMQQLDVNEWMGVLKLSDQWCLDDLRAQAIKETGVSVIKMPLTERIALSKRYNVSSWLIDAYEAICKRKDGISRDERDCMGHETFFRLVHLREKSWAWAASGEGRNRAKFNFRAKIHDIFGDELCKDADYRKPGTPLVAPIPKPASHLSFGFSDSDLD
ncbi:unnamed protein product [Peniophora sp. CBMAI 1063]|nr:unnamed protein product [Peniophora sp. CBMAI 1063]